MNQYSVSNYRDPTKFHEAFAATGEAEEMWLTESARGADPSAEPSPYARHEFITRISFLQELSKTESYFPTDERTQLAAWCRHFVVERNLFAENQLIAKERASHTVFKHDRTESLSLRGAWSECFRTTRWHEWSEGIAAKYTALAHLYKRREEKRAALYVELKDATDLHESRKESAAIENDLAGLLLKRTHALAKESQEEASRKLESESPESRTMAHALATEVSVGWPKAFSLRAFESLLPGWLDARIDMRPFSRSPFSPLYNGASALRSFERFGELFRRAPARSKLPYVLRRSPTRSEVARFGALVGSLPLSLAFQKRALDAGNVAGDQVRSLSRAALFELRKRAAVVLISNTKESDRQGLADELTLSVFGPRFSSSFLLGASFRERAHTHTAFLAMLESVVWRNHLVATFDDDWFRNPRCIEHLHVQRLTAIPPFALGREEATSALHTELSRLEEQCS